MKKQLTLHEKFLRIKAQELLERIGTPIRLPDFESKIDEEKKEGEAVIPGELESKIKKTIGKAEQFFAQFGLTPENQEELFRMPIIQECLDEIAMGVLREREELERTIGRPRGGWDLLPFEKAMETEKILQNLPQSIKNEKVETIHIDELFDRSAEAQVLAIQQRLSSTLEEIKNSFHREKEAVRLPTLPKVLESIVEVSPILELPDLQEKQSIDIDCKSHYSEQLKVILKKEDILKQTLTTAHFSSENTVQSLHTCEDENKICTLLEHKSAAEVLSNNVETHAIESTAENIEEVAPEASNHQEVVTMNEAECSSLLNGGRPISRIGKSFTAHPNRDIIISTLRSKRQYEDNEGSKAATANLEFSGNQKNTLVENLFEEMAPLNLSASKEVTYGGGDIKGGESDEKIAMEHRHSIGLRRFRL